MLTVVPPGTKQAVTSRQAEWAVCCPALHRTSSCLFRSLILLGVWQRVEAKAAKVGKKELTHAFSFPER